jgi:hypothetical protein
VPSSSVGSDEPISSRNRGSIVVIVTIRVMTQTYRHICCRMRMLWVLPQIREDPSRQCRCLQRRRL